jgi:hypothetical protein
MAKVEITIDGKRAMVDQRHVALFERKEALLQRAKDLDARHRRAPRDPAIAREMSKAMMEMVQINGEISAAGAKIKYFGR